MSNADNPHKHWRAPDGGAPPRDLLDDLERLAGGHQAKKEKPLIFNEEPTGRRRDFGVLFLGGNGLFFLAAIYLARHLGGVGELALLSFWVFYNLAVVYVLYGVMSRY